MVPPEIQMELQWYHHSLLSPTKWRERGTSGVALPLQRVGKKHASLTDSWGSRHLSWQDAAPKLEMSYPQTLGIRGTRDSESWDHLDSWQPLIGKIGWRKHSGLQIIAPTFPSLSHAPAENWKVILGAVKEKDSELRKVLSPESQRYMKLYRELWAAPRALSPH